MTAPFVRPWWFALFLAACAHQADDCDKMLTCGYFPELDAGQGGVLGQGGSTATGSGGTSTAVGGAGIAGAATGGRGTSSGSGGVGTGEMRTGGTLAGGAGIGGAATGGAATGGIGTGTGGIATDIDGIGTGGIGTGGTVATGGIGTGGLATGGAGTGGFVSSCNPTCSDTKPICNEGEATCVECLNNGNCPSSKPACNPATNTCVGCMADGYCSAPTPACNMATYTCVGCMSNAYCSSPTPACNTATNLCVQCTKDTNCSGATPACNTATNACLQCTGNSNCTGTASLCDTGKNTCVECLSSTDCKNATASVCIAGKCEPCATNADCSHLSGTTVCKSEPAADAGAETGACVQCTVDDETPCGSKSCNPATNACTNTDRGSVDICHSCMADSECIGGDVEDGGTTTARCVSMTFKGAAHGNYCLQRYSPISSVGCGRPYFLMSDSIASVSGAAAETYCGVNQSATTCEAVLDLIASAPCSTDNNCGQGSGGLCKTVGGTPNRCTIPCIVTAECVASPAPGSVCSPPTTPWCH